ncbi:MAG: hypothetical protein K8H88_09900 [Sandaracinaceae bacterium]|nr:hypothetical protein [Sandaracinaceae bacterium]
MADDGHDGTLNQYPPETLGTSGPWLVRRLEEEGVELRDTCAFVASLSTLADYRSRVLADTAFRFGTHDDAYSYLAAALGTDFVCRAIHHGWVNGLRPHHDYWSRLAISDPNLFRAGESTTGRNLAWELVIAGIASTFVDGVELSEPDVVCRWRGRSVNLAAKVAYSANKLWKNVGKGVEQSTKRSGDLDLVFVNVIALLPAVEWFRESSYQAFSDPVRAVGWVKDRARDWCDKPELREMCERLEGEAPRPITIAFFMPLLVTVSGIPWPFFYTHTPLTTSGDDYEFVREFSKASARILREPLPA